MQNIYVKTKIEKFADLLFRLLETIKPSNNEESSLKKIILPIEEIDGVTNITCEIIIEVYSNPTNRMLDNINFCVVNNFSKKKHLYNFLMVFNRGEIKKPENLLHFSSELLENILPKLGLHEDGLGIVDNERRLLTEIDNAFRVLNIPENIIISDNKCCVCYEKTNIKTICNHSLCYRCWSKIKPTKNLINDDYNCPICRTVIN